MKQIIFLFMVLVAASAANAQDYLTRNGNVSFFSHTSMEDIKALNTEAVSTLNSSTGDIEFRIAIKSFHFAKAAMEEHFNDENYMNSEKFPKASFKGKIENISAVNFTKNGTYNVTVEGSLTIKDVTKTVSVPGTVTIKDGKVIALATFKVKRKDYNVMGQSFAQSKIADEIEISVNCEYSKR